MTEVSTKEFFEMTRHSVFIDRSICDIVTKYDKELYL